MYAIISAWMSYKNWAETPTLSVSTIIKLLLSFYFKISFSVLRPILNDFFQTISS